MKVLLVFEDWQKNYKSVYDTEDGVGLTWGPFHHGTTFEAEIQLEPGDAEELEKSIKDGFTPVWATLIPD